MNSVRLSHSENALKVIPVTLFGISTFFSAQPLKACMPIVVTPSGISTLSSAEQSWKVRALIAVTEAGILTVFSPVHS